MSVGRIQSTGRLRALQLHAEQSSCPQHEKRGVERDAAADHRAHVLVPPRHGRGIGLSRELEVTPTHEQADRAERGEHRLPERDTESDHRDRRRDRRDVENRMHRRPEVSRRATCGQYADAVIHGDECNEEQVDQERHIQPDPRHDRRFDPGREWRARRVDCQWRRKEQQSDHDTGAGHPARSKVEDAAGAPVKRTALPRDRGRPERGEAD